MVQLLNLKKYKNAKFYFKNQQIYLDIEDEAELIAIEDLEMYMAAAHKALSRLIELNEVQSKL